MSLTKTQGAGAERVGFSARVEPRRLRPRLNFGHYQGLHALIRDLEGREFDDRIARIRACIDTAEAWRVQLLQLGVGDDDLQPTLFYLTTLRLLRDLLLQGWTVGLDDDGICGVPAVVRWAEA